MLATTASSPSPASMSANPELGVDLSRRVLMLVPTARDLQVTTSILAQSRLTPVACSDPTELSREIGAGVGAILLTDEALVANGIDLVIAALDREPAWSEPPFVALLSNPEVSPVRATVLQRLGNVTVLERPAPIRSVLSAVQAALRGRERQYQIRDRVHAFEESERRSRQLQQQLELAVNASELGTFHCEMPLGQIIWNDRCKAHFWLPPDAEVDFDLFYSILHPDDREPTRRAVEACVYGGVPYDVEYRTVSARNDIRWIRATGRTYFDAEGNPVRFDGTTQDITERKAREEELQEASRRKDEFLAMLAHELRNPLAPIRTSVEIMRAIDTVDPRVRETSDIIRRQVQHLARLVDDLLDVSRVTQGKVNLEREPLEVTDVIQRGIELARHQIDGKRHALTITLPPRGELVIDGDATRLAQVIGNLLDNAAKYTEPGGTIQLAAAREREQVVIRVRDNGVGITADLLPRVFDLFTQGERSLDRTQGGLGIGLSLVKTLVRLHGGAVEATSQGPGRGSEFVVRLPASQLPRMDRSNAIKGTATERPIPRRILVVDDNDDAAETMRMLLELEGHEIRCAGDGVHAIEVAQEFQPEVGLLDIGLPRMDGYELAKRLRALPAMRQARLIALTGYGHPEDHDRAASAGFDHHLTKPVDPQTLLALIDAPPRSPGSE